jgi:pimeloyl-ACP methyl ester carboxylesterase
MPAASDVRKATAHIRAEPRLDPREELFRIPGPRTDLRLFLRYLPPADEAGKAVVLYIHGATFPSALSIAHRFDGRSWRDELCASGFHVWGLDFQGYGASDRYPEMDAPADHNPALGRAEDAAKQIEAAVRYILDFHKTPKISMIAHSWGSMAAGRFAGQWPELVDRIVFFAPIAMRVRGTDEQERVPAGAWRLITLQAQWDRFTEDVPAGHPAVLARRHFDEWGELYLDTDPESRSRAPAGVKVPSGPVRDISAAWRGDLAYDPGQIKAPVAIIRGEWDETTSSADAAWIFSALRSSRLKRQTTIGGGTHLMHLERSRYALYRETETFLLGKDEPVEPGESAETPPTPGNAALH